MNKKRERKMKKEVLVFVVLTFCLLIPSFAPLASAAGQPPINTSTFYEGTTAWGPVDADPVFAYDTQSEQLLFNAYQNLIAFHGELYYQFDPVLATNIPTRQDITLTVQSTSAVGLDPTGSTWTDGTKTYTITGWTDELMNGFGSGDAVRMTDGTTWRTWTADVVSGISPTMTMQLWRGSYVFNIRTSPMINFYTSTGAVYDTFGLKDAVYCLQRLMVFDKIGYPSWMFDKPLFDVADHTQWDNSTVMELAHLINDAIVGDFVANALTINIGDHFPDNLFKQVLANTWGSIYSSKYFKDQSNWDGDLFTTTKYGEPIPDWWIDWANQGLGLSASALHAGTADAGLDVPAPTSYCGSGPYYVGAVDPVEYKVILQRNPSFWMGWPAPGCASYLDTVEIGYISDWTTRKADFLGGFIDTCYVPRANMFDLLDNTTKNPLVPAVKTISNILPALSIDSIQFQFLIDPTSSYIGTGGMPGGIPVDFFNNTHTRRAFAYSFNWSTYGQQAFYGESDYRENPLALGLYPDYYNSSIPGYYESLAAAEAELKAAVVDGQNVWNTGFTLTMTYDAGSDERGTACLMISNFFATLSTYDGRYGNPFTVKVASIGSNYVGLAQAGELPIYAAGWKADFADADDFLRPYMYSTGALAYYQGYTADNGWGIWKDVIVDTAVLTPDGPARQALYNQLQMIYYNDCPSFLIVQPRGRRFQWYWVKGWYYDAVYPSDCYYQMFKAEYSWFDVSGPTPGVPDGHVNVYDYNWSVLHFNAKAPIPGVPIDPKWIGVYGCGACDVIGDRKVDAKDIIAIAQSSDNVRVQELDSAKTIIGQGYEGNLSVTVSCRTFLSWDFNVTTYANTAIIAALNFDFTGTGVQSQAFVWNASGFAYGNYTLEACADVSAEMQTGDDNYTCTYSVHVGVPGDVSSTTPGVYDGVTNMKDIAYMVAVFNTRPGSANWNPNADVDNDGICNIRDIAICVAYFNQHE